MINTFSAEITIHTKRGQLPTVTASSFHKTVSGCFCNKMCKPDYLAVYKEAPIKRKKFIMVFIQHSRGKFFRTGCFVRRGKDEVGSCFIPDDWKGKRFNVVYI